MAKVYYPIGGYGKANTHRLKMSVDEIRRQHALVLMSKKTHAQVAEEFNITPRTWTNYRARYTKHGRTMVLRDGTSVRTTTYYDDIRYPSKPRNPDGSEVDIAGKHVTDFQLRAVTGVPKENFWSHQPKEPNTEPGTPGRKPSPKRDPSITAAAKRIRKADAL